MAVIRANRLWAARVGPEFSRGDGRMSTLYTAPAGYRAIIRGVTATINSPPEGSNPCYVLYLTPAGQATIVLRWIFFSVPGTGEAADRYLFADSWNPMVVLHSGDRIECANMTSAMLDVTGSGHVLPELTSS